MAASQRVGAAQGDNFLILCVNGHDGKISVSMALSSSSSSSQQPTTATYTKSHAPKDIAQMLRSQTGIGQATVCGTLAVVGCIGASVPKGNVGTTRQFDSLRAGHGPQIGPRNVGILGLDGFQDLLHDSETGVGAVCDFGFKALS